MINPQLIGHIVSCPRWHIFGFAYFSELLVDSNRLNIIVFAALSCIVQLLLLYWPCILLLIIHFLSELSLNDGKCQIEQEESSDKDDRVEVDHDPGANWLHKADHDGRPTFQRSHLEDLEHGKGYVVKVCRTIGWILIWFSTIEPWLAIIASTTESSKSSIYNSSVYIKTSVF